MLKFPAVPAGKVNGALAAFSCAITCRVCVLNRVDPAMNCVPSGETESVFERLVTARLRKTVPEATSYTKTTLPVVETPSAPIMYFPSAVAIRRLGYELKTRPDGGGSVAGVGAGGTTGTLVITLCDAVA